MEQTSPNRWYFVLSAASGAVAVGMLMAFFAQYGVDVELLFASLRHNGMALILAADLLILAAWFLAWSYRDSRRLGVRGWPVVALLTCCVALSCSVPLYLYLRQRAVASDQRRHVEGAGTGAVHGGGDAR